MVWRLVFPDQSYQLGEYNVIVVPTKQYPSRYKLELSFNQHLPNRLNYK